MIHQIHTAVLQLSYREIFIFKFINHFQVQNRIFIAYFNSFFAKFQFWIGLDPRKYFSSWHQQIKAGAQNWFKTGLKFWFQAFRFLNVLCPVDFFQSPKLKTGYRNNNQFWNPGFANGVRQSCGYQYFLLWNIILFIFFIFSTFLNLLNQNLH